MALGGKMGVWRGGGGQGNSRRVWKVGPSRKGCEGIAERVDVDEEGAKGQAWHVQGCDGKKYPGQSGCLDKARMRDGHQQQFLCSPL